MIEAFVLNLLDGVQIRRAWRLRPQWNHRHDQQENQQGIPMLPHIRLQAGFVLQTCLMGMNPRSEEHTSELQSRRDLVCRLLLEKKKKKLNNKKHIHTYHEPYNKST